MAAVTRLSVDARTKRRCFMSSGNHSDQQFGKSNRALNRNPVAAPDRSTELHGVTAAVVAVRIERIQLCPLKKWRLWRHKGILVGYMTNRKVRSNKGRHNWEVFDNVDRATFQWDDPPYCLESFDRVYPRPTTPRPSSYLRESVPDLLMPGLSPRGVDTFPDVAKCASA